MLTPFKRLENKIAELTAVVRGASSTAEVQMLRDRVEELERLLGMRMPMPRTIPGVTAIGWDLFGLLIRWPMVTREFAFSSLYGGRPEADQPKSLRIIDVMIFRLAAALRPHGISIKTERFTGYYLDEENRKRALQLVNKVVDPRPTTDFGSSRDRCDQSGAVPGVYPHN